MTAQEVTAHLGGKWHRGYGTAPCPVCQAESRNDQDALTVRDGYEHLLLNCKKSHCDFRDIAAAADITSGDWQAPDPAIAAQREAEEQRKAAQRASMASRTWAEARPATGTPVEYYLQGRGITCDIPDTIRFHGRCWHGKTAKKLPAMIGLVTPADAAQPSLFAIHRTYLAIDSEGGTGKADVTPNKAMLGSTAGKGVRIAFGAGPLVVCEGMETGLSLASGLLRAPDIPDPTIIAALSASGMRGFILPSTPADLIIAMDGDTAGREAGKALAERADANGWNVRLMDPPDGLDWNDVLIQKGVQ